ncbi:RNA polymerase, sigma-24 subunit, ECF subfamily [Fibrisoma limi BUZ 3]|uniref:RNA polymerase, sigma-24 subunit, ECF subfamily n=1 Tax=Fibrisoma limi BUZ 3 TaxID=1185876 RepID=I2GCX6_9BACT|nr:sigma-70 family RNA polymerase sigma factor [Fibrisoma limi]CCH51750.1 RNA polymerase, sigma-24 subunit, ECF subfamily [Fibrisoma limi BUZ 3]
MDSRNKDQALWQSFREGEKQALGQLLERYYRVLKHYGLKFMVDEAVVEDCIQDLFLQLWQNREQINDTDSVKHYLLKALRHHVLQYLRLQKRMTYEEPDWDSSLPEEPDSEALMIQQESFEQLKKIIGAQLASLPNREREALYLRFYENLSIPEIAEVMNVNRQSVSNFLQKALAKLRNQWLSPILLTFCIIL